MTTIEARVSTHAKEARANGARQIRQNQTGAKSSAGACRKSQQIHATNCTRSA